MTAYDSQEDDLGHNDLPRKRQKRFAFQSFAQRVAKVDVADVYRQGAPVRAEPLPGTGSFLHEEIQKQRELHTTAHFLQTAAAINQLAQTLPLIVHHKDAIAGTLLTAVRMEAGLSLEPILVLVAALARDLQADFLAFMPRLAGALTELVENGADREPELLQHIFGCLSSVLRHLAQWLAGDLPRALQQTALLRYHSARHVRQLAAQSMGFLLRHARGKALRAGVRTIYAEQALRPSEARAHGAGMLLAESLIGINHGLHSRAAAVVPLMLQEDILSVTDLKGTKAQHRLTQEALRERAAQVNAVALDRLLQHTRRGCLQILWETALAEADARLARCFGIPAGAMADAAKRSAARAVDTVAQMVEYIRGSRVDDYAPLFALSGRLCEMELTGSESAGEGTPAGTASLPRAALRLTAALVGGHGKDLGASGGLAVIRDNAPSWQPLLQQAPVSEVLPFIHRVLHGPGAGAAAAQALGPVLLGALWRAIQEGFAPFVLPLLMDACQALEPQGFQAPDGVPLLHTAKPGGEELAGYICKVAEQPEAGSATAWAALACLQYATTDRGKISQICDCILKASPPGSEESANGVTLQLKSQALLLKASAAPKEAMADITATALDMLKQDPTQYQVLSAAAHLLQKSKEQGTPVPGAILEDLLSLVEGNLSTRSQAVRGATLNLLCPCQQPQLPNAGNNGSSAPEEPARSSSIFPKLAQIENQMCTLENGRAAANMLSGLKTDLEYNQVPAIQIKPVVCALLGMLHVRFSLLWAPAAEALGMALKQHPDTAWPLIFSALSSTQEELLSGHGAGLAPGQFERDQEYDGTLASIEERLQKHAQQGGVAESGGCTDASVRLSTLLKALGHAPAGVVKGRAQEWVPLCLSYLSAQQHAARPDTHESQKDDAATHAADPEHSDGPSLVDADISVIAEAVHDAEEGGPGLKIGARLWRGLAKDWLTLLASLKDLRGLHGSAALRHSLAAQILSSDSSLQQAALKGLRGFHLEYLHSREQDKQGSRGRKHGIADRLLRLANDATLREELTSFPLAPSADDAIPAAHRPGVMGILVRLLWPKMRRRSGRLGGKGAPGSARAAILNAFAALQPAELRPLLALFLAPIGVALRQQGISSGEIEQGPKDELFVEPWWASKLAAEEVAWWLSTLNGERLSQLPGKQRVGLVNALGDLLRHLGHRLALYLPAITAILVVLLDGAVKDLPQDTQQLLAAQAVTSPAAEPAASNKDGPARLTADTEDAEAVSDEEEEESEGLAELAGRQQDFLAAGDVGARLSAAGADQIEARKEQQGMGIAAQNARKLADGGREVRSGALRLLASVWARFPAQQPDSPVFERFFSAVSPLMQRVTTEASAPAPPPLLQCITSFSSSPSLAPLLAQHPVMLDATISVLAAPHASPAARDASLAILEAILELDQPLQEAILGPHTRHLLQSLQRLVTAAASSSRSAMPRALKTKAKAAQKGPSRADSLRALSILERLASVEDQAADGVLVLQLSDALLPILAISANAGRKRTRGDEAATLRVLGVLAAIWSKAAQASMSGTAQAERLCEYASELAPLASSQASRDARSALALAYTALAQLLPKLQDSSALLTELNAMSTTEVDAMDYDRRLQAYSALKPEAWAAMAPVQALPLLHQSLSDMRRPDDLAIRSAAAQALGRLIAAANADAVSAQQQGDASKERAVDLVHTILFRNLRRTLPATNLAVRQEHVDLLRALALAFPARYPDLHALTDTDAELDFFNNVAHLQLHRRSRAFRRLANACESGVMSSSTLMGVAVPLLQQAIIEGKSGEGGHEMKDRERDQEANVVDTAVQVLGTVAGRLGWPQYQELLGTFNRAMQRTEGKAIIRAVCGIIDAFHFATEALEVPESANGEEGMSALPASATRQDVSGAQHVVDIQKALTRRVLPALQKQLVYNGGDILRAPMVLVMGKMLKRLPDAARRAALPTSLLVYKDGEAVRAPVALAIVKLLKRLPDAALRAALPTSLHKVANLLRTKLQRIRDDARTVYVAMVAELGPHYLKFALGVLRSALPPRGYMGHVQGYTAHAVLQAVMRDAEAGALDDVIDDILPIVEAELFGQVSEEKEANAFVGGCKEAKHLRAYATYQILARGVTFRDHMSTLLQPVMGRLGEVTNPKVRAKLQQLLQAAAQGVLANASVSPADLLIFVHGILEAGIAAEEAAQLAVQAAAEAPGASAEGPEAPREQHTLIEMAMLVLLAVMWKASRDRTVCDAGSSTDAPEAAQEQHLLMEMALLLLLAAINKASRNRIDVRDPAMLGMLDGLLPLLVRAMRSRYGSVASAALRIFSVLVPLSLPAMPEQAPKAGAALTALLRRAPDSNAPIAQECFKLLGTLMRSCASYQPGTEELRFLLKWSFGDVEASRSRVSAFALLKAVVSRKLVVPEVYDLMERVQELMIKSHEPSVRAQCSGMLLQFILDYPLGTKRLQHHLQFLITNLSFEHESGRQAAVDTIKALTVRFPEALIEEWASVLFVALAARLVNDSSADCRSMYIGAAQALLQRASPALADRLAGFCMQWLAGEDARMARAAAQMLGVLATVEGVRFGRRIPGLLKILLPALQRAAQEEEGDAEAEAELSAFSSWQMPYFCLTLVEKAAEINPKQVSFSTAQGLWLALPALLSHSHLWVRKAVLRLLCLGLSDSTLGDGLLKHPKAAPGRLALLGYQQLEVPAADEGLLELAGRNAALLAPLLYDADLAAGRVPGMHTNGVPGVNGASHGADDAEQAASITGVDEEGAQEDEASGSKAALTLHGMVRRVARLAGETSWTRQGARAAALRLLAALALRLAQERGMPALLPYLPAMMLPLVRLDESSHSSAAPDASLPTHLAEADVLGREVMAQLKAAVGDEAFLQALVQAKQHATAVRRLRRKQQASEKLVDPELASQKRQRKVQRRAEGLKRKHEELKKQRSAGLAVKNRRDKRVKT